MRILSTLLKLTYVTTLRSPSQSGRHVKPQAMPAKFTCLGLELESSAPIALLRICSMRFGFQCKGHELFCSCSIAGILGGLGLLRNVTDSDYDFDKLDSLAKNGWGFLQIQIAHNTAEFLCSLPSRSRHLCQRYTSGQAILQGLPPKSTNNASLSP